MTSDETVYDSPRDEVRAHIQEYVESDGVVGHLWRDCPTLLITTTGRKSGKRRRTALIYGRDGDNYIVVASWAGRPYHPLWYLNLVEHPDVDLQVGSEKLTARARTAGLEERERLWQVMAGIYPRYEEYKIRAAESGREIPVVILEPM